MRRKLVSGGVFAAVALILAMDYPARDRLAAELDSIREQGLYKTERIITTP